MTTITTSPARKGGAGALTRRSFLGTAMGTGLFAAVGGGPLLSHFVMAQSERRSEGLGK